ncbi:hypothetical protein [uncultured Nocardioides sp.]|uniref:hypothetical protein n=1 Tax=uncultured Nocardioides sp. TaxID=198441 RepID=UPI0026055DF7|nr:hypothetical protein [uncultured Nocardioides sp.]
MTTDRSPARQMLVSGSLGTVVVGAVCTVVAWFLAGTPGLWGALTGVAVVWGSSLVSIIALSATRRAEPTIALMVALVVHFGKVIVLIGALLLISSTGLLDGTLDRWSLAGTIVAVAITWSLAEINAYLRTRQPTYDLDAA